jgi:fucose permease
MIADPDLAAIIPNNLRMARFALSAVFFINGGAVATWASRIPAIQEKLALGSGQLGIALLSMAVGALIAMSLAGAMSTRSGSRPVIVWNMILSCFSLLLPAFAPNLVLLSLSVGALGLFLGSMDVAMNAHAIAIERAYGRPIMSSFHALFSIGGVSGAALGTLMAGMNVAPEVHFCISAVILLMLGLVSKRWLLPASADATGSKISASIHLETLQSLFSSKFLLAASIIMFCCFLVEGAMGDWSGVFLRQVLKTDSGFAVLGYACFSVTMCIGRLTGDAVIQKLGAFTVICVGCLVALAGLCLVIVPSNAISALFGFACIGIGVSNIVPIAFSCGGNAPNM